MGNHVEIQQIITGCLKNSIEFVSFWLKNQYFPGLLFRLPMVLEWEKIYSIHQFMYVEPDWYARILEGCPKNSIEFFSFWLNNQYIPVSLLRLPVSFHGIRIGKNMFHSSI